MKKILFILVFVFSFSYGNTAPDCGTATTKYLFHNGKVWSTTYQTWSTSITASCFVNDSPRLMVRIDPGISWYTYYIYYDTGTTFDETTQTLNTSTGEVTLTVSCDSNTEELINGECVCKGGYNDSKTSGTCVPDIYCPVPPMIYTYPEFKSQVQQTPNS